MVPQFRLESTIRHVEGYILHPETAITLRSTI